MDQVCHGEACMLDATHKCGFCGLAKYCDSEDHQEAYEEHLRSRCIGLKLYVGNDPPAGSRDFGEDAGDELQAPLQNLVNRLTNQIISVRGAKLRSPVYAEIDAYFDERFLPLLALIRARAAKLSEPLRDELPVLFKQYAAEYGSGASGTSGRPKRQVRQQAADDKGVEFGPPRTGESIEDIYVRWRKHREGKDFTEQANLISRRYASYSKLNQLVQAVLDLEKDLAFPSQARVLWMTGLRDALQEVAQLVGMSNAKASLARLVRSLYASAPFMYAQDRFFNFTIMGEPGVGKTQLAKLLGNVMHHLGLSPVYSRTIVTSTSDWIASYEGQTQSKAANRFASSLGGVVFMDEAYGLIGEGETKGFGREALSQIINDMEVYKGLSILVFGGYENDIKNTLYAANPGLTRRVPYEFYLLPYTATEMGEILELKIALSDTLTVNPDDILNHVDWFDVSDTGQTIRAAHAAGAFSNRNGSGAQTIINIAVDLIADLLYASPALADTYQGVIDNRGAFTIYGALRKARGKRVIPRNARRVYVLDDDILSKAVIAYTRDVTRDRVYVYE